MKMIGCHRCFFLAYEMFWVEPKLHHSQKFEGAILRPPSFQYNIDFIEMNIRKYIY